MLKTTDNQTLLAGVNAVGVVSLLAYTLRTFNEVNSNIDELRNEMESFRKNYSENNKRSNIAFNHLNTKLEENSRMIQSRIHSRNQMTERREPRRVNYHREPEPENDIEEVEEIEEISTFSTNVNDEISGALSELLGN